MLNIFLFLTYKMQKFCNLTLSCGLFEEFAGYPGLCDKFFPRLDTETELHTEDDLLKEEISSYLDKLYAAPDSTGMEMEDHLKEIDMSFETIDWLVEKLCEDSEGDGEDDSKDSNEDDGKGGFLLDMALARYVLFFIGAVIQRDINNFKIQSAKDLHKNKWADKVWNDPILIWFRDELRWPDKGKI